MDLGENQRNLLSGMGNADKDGGMRHLCFLTWPSIRQVLSTVNITFDDEQMRRLEHRPVLFARRGLKQRGTDKHASFPAPVDDVVTSHGRASPSPSTGPDAQFEVMYSPDEIFRTRSIPSTVAQLINGFLAQIGARYPLLDSEILRSLFQQCSRQQQHSTRFQEQVSIASITTDDDRGRLKRQRADSGLLQQSPVSSSPESALIMLCCALGELILHGNMVSAPLDSLQSGESKHRGTTQSYVPGMRYFVTATEMASNFIDGQDLIHAQVFLLAGMYKALCMRLNEASRDIRPNLAERTSTASGQEPCEDLVLRAAWTCVQLELEKLPELQLPSSGLENVAFALMVPQTYENATDGSSLSLTKSELSQTERQRLPFAAQIHLRKIRLAAQHQLYSDRRLDTSPESVDCALKALASKLQEWRAQLHPFLQWDDENPPSSDLALAHLRYQYWEVKLMLLRPFLDYKIRSPLSGQSVNVDDSSKLADLLTANHYFWNTIRHKESICGTTEVQSLAHLSIEATLQSARSFDAIPQKHMLSSPDALPIAHARFINLILLTATHRSSDLCHLVPKQELARLLANTITRLSGLEAMSPTAKMELNVLNSVQTSIL
ncbi:hypothetical protein M409DRAFT_22753 [Zasmidium cellare ATCC 36951]|uniref:Transcription factor domain-containing protein n=1 Tax=Zasmidium cellare ATCC 36951 TaxID=1080233 RepID=A0A6A6CHT0_ZASCE|nr:uncharacterized protein M409DRAFT_22753 [Zasmidium cellare ATCC 36951]KAF2166695.1 hypothetical protein M409DRAFT_22753 [Zasmidium cellare ATCC 36951]